jgi:rubredoxin
MPARGALPRRSPQARAMRQNPESDIAKKKAEADRLRAAEKFMVVGTGEATCPGCGYEYRPKAGDSEYPVPPGTLFQARRPRMRGGPRDGARRLAGPPRSPVTTRRIMHLPACLDVCRAALTCVRAGGRQDLPRDWQCPICGAEKAAFQSKAREIAGFAENQRYGLGTNSMTSGQKGALIWGSLLAFFGLFIAGYFVQ